MAGIADEEEQTRASEEDSAQPTTTRDCLCFRCSVKRLVDGMNERMARQYGGVVKSRGEKCSTRCSHSHRVYLVNTGGCPSMLY